MEIFTLGFIPLYVVIDTFIIYMSLHTIFFNIPLQFLCFNSIKWTDLIRSNPTLDYVNRTNCIYQSHYSAVALSSRLQVHYAQIR